MSLKFFIKYLIKKTDGESKNCQEVSKNGFMCSICSDGFSCKDNLRRHMLKTNDNCIAHKKGKKWLF